jgi:hypothetical protein
LAEVAAKETAFYELRALQIGAAEVYIGEIHIPEWCSRIGELPAPLPQSIDPEGMLSQTIKQIV